MLYWCLDLGHGTIVSYLAAYVDLRSLSRHIRPLQWCGQFARDHHVRRVSTSLVAACTWPGFAALPSGMTVAWRASPIPLMGPQRDIERFVRYRPGAGRV